MKTTKAVVAVAMLAVGLVQAASAENLYFKIVDGSGKLIGQAATDSADVSGLEKSLQATYPGIKLSIANCRQPTLAESMDPVYGTSWPGFMPTIDFPPFSFEKTDSHKAVAASLSGHKFPFRVLPSCLAATS